MAVDRLRSLLNQREIVDIFFWQTLGAILQATLAPEIAALSQESFKLTPTLVLGAAELADAVVRGHMKLEEAQQQARQGGLSEANFGILVDGTGEPLPLQSLMEAFRRGFIPKQGTGPESVSLEQGIRESRLKDKWIPTAERLQFAVAPPGTVVEGWLRGQLKPEDAIKLLAEAGVDEATGTLMFKASGRPPGPQELVTLYLRGVIPESDPDPDHLSLRQGFLETDLKDKWYPAWKELAVYLPPPRTITALLRAGSISEAVARDLFRKSGLPEDLTAAYIADASNQKTAGSKDLAKADVLAMYGAREITRQQAHDYLIGQGYDETATGFELDYQDFKLIKAQVDALTTRIRALYVGHKISKQAAVDALSNVGMAPEVVSNALAVWDQEANANPTLLTAVQIASLAALGSIDPLDAYNELQGRGYDARDAYGVLVLHKVDVSTIPAPAGIIAPQ